ncbi:MAG: phage virion morphogenesis protein [Chitinophagaceae bacterium]|nr:phage virion morphogenesis protein [Chitinophagaceae bacterium]
MKPKLSIKADDVINKFKNAMDLTKNLKPLMIEIVGKQGSNDPLTIRGGIAKAFQTKGSSIGQEWMPLSYDYAISKMKKHGQKPTLVATGELFNSLVYSNNSSVNPMEGNKLVYGTTLTYALFHQKGGKHLPQRSFLAITTQQRRFWKVLISEYFKAAMNGEEKRAKA